MEAEDWRGKTWCCSSIRAMKRRVCPNSFASVRDKWERYKQTGAEVRRINTDSVEKHRALPSTMVCRFACFPTLKSVIRPTR